MHCTTRKGRVRDYNDSLSNHINYSRDDIGVLSSCSVYESASHTLDVEALQDSGLCLTWAELWVLSLLSVIRRFIIFLRHKSYLCIPSSTTCKVKALRSPYPGRIHRTLVFALFASILLQTVSAAGTTFDQCTSDVLLGKHGLDLTGGTDNHGNPVANITDATAITYQLCLQECGSGPDAFSWSTFSQEFGAWLLPWLALVSQLPFGAKLRQDNLMSVILTIGSPTLAAYSLALTVLNGQWVARRFEGLRYPNSQRAVHILRSLQQVPLKISKEHSLLASLIVLPENDKWWREFDERLDYTHTWSIAAATSIAWVVIAYIFTVIDSFSSIMDDINSNGQGVGSAWLWLLPIVTGWLQVSPKCDSGRLGKAIEHANALAYTATANGVAQEADDISMERALSFQEPNQGSAFRMLQCSPPVYNYARFLSWIQAVEEIHSAFHSASVRARAHQPVSRSSQWVRGTTAGEIHDANRSGTAEEVEAYCTPSSGVSWHRWGPGFLSRFFLASALALGLQWGTAGAAIMIVWYTPTTGLGCRSGAYMLHAATSTIVWMMLVVSSVLSHYSSFETPSRYRLSSFRAAELLSVGLRRLGNTLATFNALWIIVSCMFQFGNFFDRCYCNSSVIGLKSRAFDVIIPGHYDIVVMQRAWIAGVGLALGCAAVFVFVLGLIFTPPE